MDEEYVFILYIFSKNSRRNRFLILYTRNKTFKTSVNKNRLEQRPKHYRACRNVSLSLIDVTSLNDVIPCCVIVAAGAGGLSMTTCDVTLPDVELASGYFSTDTSDDGHEYAIYLYLPSKTRSGLRYSGERKRDRLMRGINVTRQCTYTCGS